MKWFVERLLRPDELAPDPEPLLRGELAHRVLEETLRALVSAGGGAARPSASTRPAPLLREALDAPADDARISRNPERLRAALRRLEADLLRYLEHAAHARLGASCRAHFELRFGGARDDLRGRAELAGGELRLAGRIDRIDVGAGRREAIVYDYKGKSAPPPQAQLARGGASSRSGSTCSPLPQLLGLEAVGGLYQPLGARGPAAARAAARRRRPAASTRVRNDRLDDRRVRGAAATRCSTPRWRRCAASARARWRRGPTRAPGPRRLRVPDDLPVRARRARP